MSLKTGSIEQHSKLKITLILGALTTVSPLSVDMYLPAFQRMADDFATTTSKVALSLASYFIGLAAGQIFYGPLLDRFGRKKPLYFGLALFVVSSLICGLAQSANQLIVARLFQSLGGCAAAVAATAMVRDFFSPHEATKVFSRLMLILSVSPLFAPTLGGWIVSVAGWQAVFVTLALIGMMYLAVVFFLLPEGHQPDPTVTLKLKPIAQTFAEIFRDRQFFTYTVSGAFSFAGLFTYLAGAPAIFMTIYRLTENQFGLVFAFLSIGMVGGGQFNIWLSRRFSTLQIYRTAMQTQTLIGVLFLLGCSMEWWNLYSTIAMFFVYMSCVGLTYPNAAALALAPFQRNAGSASALLGTIQMGVGAIASALYGFLKFTPTLSVAMMFVVTSVVGGLVYSRRPKELVLSLS